MPLDHILCGLVSDLPISVLLQVGATQNDVVTTRVDVSRIAAILWRVFAHGHFNIRGLDQDQLATDRVALRTALQTCRIHHCDTAGRRRQLNGGLTECD